MNWEMTGDITQSETFAEGSKIRELHRLLDTYGGKNWKNAKVLRVFASCHLAKFFKLNYIGTKLTALVKLK